MCSEPSVISVVPFTVVQNQIGPTLKVRAAKGSFISETSLAVLLDHIFQLLRLKCISWELEGRRESKLASSFLCIFKNGSCLVSKLLDCITIACITIM